MNSRRRLSTLLQTRRKTSLRIQPQLPAELRGMLAEQRGSWAPAPGGGFLLAGLARIEEGPAQFGMLDFNDVVVRRAVTRVSSLEEHRLASAFALSPDPRLFIREGVNGASVRRFALEDQREAPEFST